MAEVVGFEPTDAGVKVPCLDQLGYTPIIGPDDTIRTCDILLPKQALYQTELHLDYGANGGDRTLTVFLPWDFKSHTSASSVTLA